MILYHFLSFQNALDDILNHHIKVATLDQVNDPYEWVFCLKAPDGTLYPTSRVRDWWHARYKDKIGFISFSKYANNPVMWSHYADRHRGIALGFEVDLSKTNIHKVRYCAKRPVLDDVSRSSESEIQELYRQVISVKYKSWAYETEHRAYVDLVTMCRTRVDDHHGCLMYFYPMDADILRLHEVIVGCDAHPRVKEIENALSYGDWRNVGVRKAHLSPSTYRLEIDSRQEAPHSVTMHT